jgi:hypothetical protein
LREAEEAWESRLVQRGEVALALGCSLTAASALMIVQVMLGLLAFLIAPVAFVMLIIGVIRARETRLPAVRQWLGFLLVVAGLSALVWTSLQAAEYGASLALHGQRIRQGGAPTSAPIAAGDGIQSVATWLGSFLVGIGLWLRAAWSGPRCMVWALVVLLIPPAIIVFFHCFGHALPLSA